VAEEDHLEIRTLRQAELEDALAVAGETVSPERLRMHAGFPDLFTCCCDGGTTIGVCCGWPIRSQRDGSQRMRLDVIAILPEHQRNGHGSRLLRYWEDQVRARGDWTIDLGSDADGFYLKAGYTALQYVVEVPEDKLPHDHRELGFDISHVRHTDDPAHHAIYAHARAGDRYDARVLERMRRVFCADSSFTVFEKRVSSSRTRGPAGTAD